MNCWCDTLMHHLPIFIIPKIYLMKYDLCLNYLNFINDDCCCCCCYLDWILTRCDLWCITRQSQHSLKSTCIINTSKNTTTTKISNLMLMMRRKHIFCIIHVKFVRVSVCIGMWQGRSNVSHLTQYITRLLFVHKKT